MDRNRFARVCGIAPLVLLALVHLTPAAFAQEVNEAYIVDRLGPAAEELQRAGIDGSGGSTPAMIEILQRWGIEPAYWVSPDEARMLVRAEREDRARGRLASMVDPRDTHPSQIAVARFGVLRAGLTCGQAQEKARTAQRLADTLSRVSQLNGVGTGLVAAISQGAARFVGPLGFATVVTSMASTWASQLAHGYRNSPCVVGGQLWRFRPNVLKASYSPDPSHALGSSPGRPGSRSAALPTGPTFRPRQTEYPFISQSGSGRWPSL